MWRYFVPVIVLAVLAAFFYGGLGLNPSKVTSPLLGKPMPEFSLPTVRDPAINVGSADIEGQVALLNVWGTWCVECRHEHPFLLELARSSGIPIYGLNINDEERTDAVAWLDELGDPYIASAYDADGRVAIDWGVYGAPETFLIGRDGTVLHKHITPLTPSVWRRDFLPLIQRECGTLPCPLVDRE
jgi:cytochrome c biogenesis protein CcmG/thiol:disulfide interchange protein DsbE